MRSPHPSGESTGAPVIPALALSSTSLVRHSVWITTRRPAPFFLKQTHVRMPRRRRQPVDTCQVLPMLCTAVPERKGRGEISYSRREEAPAVAGAGRQRPY